MDDKIIASDAAVAFCGTLLALGISVPEPHIYQYATVRTIEYDDLMPANRAAFQLAHVEARAIALQAFAVWGEFMHLWENDAAAEDLESLADALAEVHARAEAFLR